MKTAVVVFLYSGKESKPYNYAVDEYIANQLSMDEWVVVSSGRSKYNIGLFKGFQEVEDPEVIKIITQNVVMGTELIEESED